MSRGGEARLLTSHDGGRHSGITFDDADLERDGPRADPFASRPPVTTIAIRAMIGTAILIASLLAIGLVLTSVSLLDGVERWDLSINRSLADDRSDQFVTTAQRFSQMANTLPILGILAVVTIVLATRRHWWAMLMLPLAMLIEISTFLSVNYIVQRPRPDVPKVGSVPSTYSFPSGHVAATFVCWIGVALLLHAFGRTTSARVLAAVGLVVTVMTAWSRIYLGMHHTIDVTSGLLMGVCALAIAVRSTNTRLRA